MEKVKYEEWNYYHRTKEGKPTVSVCLILNTETGVFSRGVSICSKRDPIIKANGRKRARNRALAADREGTHISQLMINRKEAKEWLADVGLTPEDLCNSKGAYNIQITPFEKRLVSGHGE